MRSLILFFQLGHIGIAAQLIQTRDNSLQGLRQSFRADAVFARCFHDRCHALLLLAQLLWIGIQILLIMTQGIHRFLQVVLRTFQHGERFFQARIKLHCGPHPRGQGIQLREAGGIGIAQDLDAELSGFEQTRRMRQASIFSLQLSPIRHTEFQIFQFAALKQQQLALGQHAGSVLFQLHAPLAQSLPVAEQQRHRAGIAHKIGVAVQNVTLRIGTQQGLMRVLAVDIQQIPAHCAHLLLGGGAAIDETARAAICIEHAAHQAHTGIAFQTLLRQPRFNLRQLADVEFRANFRTFTAIAHHHRIATLAQCQRQRINQKRFSRTGLAGERSEACGKVEFE